MSCVKKYMPVTMRGRAFVWSSLTALGLRVITAICSLVQVPIALHYLGGLEFGLWITLTSIVSMMAFADFGAGYGIQNCTAEALGRGDSHVGRVIAQGVWLLMLIAIVVLVFCTLLIFFSPWSDYFTHDISVVWKLKRGALLLLVIFVLNLPCTAFQRAAVGLQLGWLVNVCSVVANGLALLFIWLTTRLSFGFEVFVVAAALPVLIGNLVLIGVLFYRGEVRGGDFKKIDINLCIGLLKMGLPFTIPQLGSLALSLAPPLIISSVLGPVSAGLYNIAQRLISVFVSLHGVIISNLWPAFTEARARDDWGWLVVCYRRSLWLSAVLVALPILLFPVWAPWVLLYWLGAGVKFGLLFMTIYGLQSAVTVMSQPPAILLNSMGKVKGQASYGFLVALISVLGMPYCVSKWGLVGAPGILLLCFSVISLPLIFWEARTSLNGRLHSV